MKIKHDEQRGKKQLVLAQLWSMSWKHVAIRGCPCTVHDITQQIVQIFCPNLSFSAYLSLSHRTSLLTVLLGTKRSTIICFLCLKDQTLRMVSLLSKVEADHRLISCACTHMCTLMSPPPPPSPVNYVHSPSLLPTLTLHSLFFFCTCKHRSAQSRHA